MKRMSDVNLWPSLTFLFAGVNLAAWYFHGATLFSWWWFLPVVAVQLMIESIALGVAKAIIKNR